MKNHVNSIIIYHDANNWQKAGNNNTYYNFSNQKHREDLLSLIGGVPPKKYSYFLKGKTLFNNIIIRYVSKINKN